VSKQQTHRAGFLECFAKGPIAGLSGCVLRAFTAANLHNLGQHGGEPPAFGAAGSSRGNVGGIRLKLVVNDDGANLEAQFREFESRCPSKSQRISAATQGDEVETL
jgi:hypothetical protein